MDFHAEATGEKVSMGWHVDGRVSAVLGTHTHVQTGDARILPNGTAYLSDVGMTGSFDSALGMSKEVALNRFILQTAHKYEPATKDPRISYALVRVEVASGRALGIEHGIHPRLFVGAVSALNSSSTPNAANALEEITPEADSDDV
jgi:2',3'-cyclic-nucleotide 2'-phosphodiesterase